VARLDQIHPDNVAGDWYADTRCIACDVARHYAPDLIGADDRGLSVVLRQPGTDEQELELWRAALACPTQSIGTRSRRHAPPGVFPHRLTDEVSLCGYNDESSFGAHSYLVERPAGNLLVDSPRYTRRLVEPFAERGGLAHILLTHQDDVADHRAWAERFGARTWIHEIERHAAPEATDLLEGEEPKVIGPGLVAVPVPGHTRGSVAYHLDDRYLFTGDTLAWDPGIDHLDVFPGATWYSWAELARSIARLADLRVEWVLPGHGMWHHVGFDVYAEQMAELAERMTRVDRRRWHHEPW
jgi:glyoxylase-like metal-dependent hydrolase (beta-lactamase superfamily II)/ferredoxin